MVSTGDGTTSALSELMVSREFVREARWAWELFLKTDPDCVLFGLGGRLTVSVLA